MFRNVTPLAQGWRQIRAECLDTEFRSVDARGLTSERDDLDSPLRRRERKPSMAAVTGLVAALLLPPVGPVWAHPDSGSDTGTASEPGDRGDCPCRDRGTLRASYEPSPEPGFYSTEYMFATTRSLANSKLVPAARAPLFLFTIPIDIGLLPIAAIAGFWPGDR
jgi:hypothetical protein